ncbi:heavy-metal-associated domain-containing protein [Noviherbaspirillum suwonense]|uniref:heavy-metal-associated domain-containing protein n=1 Tax=Noviherbaspirillum suwonense TaxID=1224511 RepID=UPI0024B696EE|nr:cation transporter [Noviherbaspirillum suwonense]
MYELQVEEITCGGCVRGVTCSVQTVDSAAKVDVDLKPKTVRVNSTAPLEAVTSAIAEAGYPVTASSVV